MTFVMTDIGESEMQNECREVLFSSWAPLSSCTLLFKVTILKIWALSEPPLGTCCSVSMARPSCLPCGSLLGLPLHTHFSATLVPTHACGHHILRLLFCFLVPVTLCAQMPFHFSPAMQLSRLSKFRP